MKEQRVVRENISVNAGSDPASLDKEAAPGAQNLEAIRTISRVPGNANYYEKNGLRTYGDDEDHDHEPPVSLDSRRQGRLSDEV